MARDNPRTLRRIPKAKWRDVTRGEYNALVEILNERGEIIAAIHKTLDVQFERIAHLQAELDLIRSACAKKPARQNQR